jgi:hypothetical protein
LRFGRLTEESSRYLHREKVLCEYGVQLERCSILDPYGLDAPQTQIPKLTDNLK